jgi:hypothetical protein
MAQVLNSVTAGPDLVMLLAAVAQVQTCTPLRTFVTGPLLHLFIQQVIVPATPTVLLQPSMTELLRKLLLFQLTGIFSLAIGNAKSVQA